MGRKMFPPSPVAVKMSIDRLPLSEYDILQIYQWRWGYGPAQPAIQEAQPSDFDWDVIFDGADWFHFTGITPALGPNLVEICKEACVAAKKHGVKISCDLNYRGKLWTREQARAAMTELCQYVDVCISNEEDAKDVFGIEAENTDLYGGKLNKEGYKSVASSTPINATGWPLPLSDQQMSTPAKACGT